MEKSCCGKKVALLNALSFRAKKKFKKVSRFGTFLKTKLFSLSGWVVFLTRFSGFQLHQTPVKACFSDSFSIQFSS
jgi:hypothetical protein